jgi:hypothetical protein
MADDEPNNEDMAEEAAHDKDRNGGSADNEDMAKEAANNHTPAPGVTTKQTTRMMWMRVPALAQMMMEMNPSARTTRTRLPSSGSGYEAAGGNESVSKQR